MWEKLFAWINIMYIVGKILLLFTTYYAKFMWFDYCETDTSTTICWYISPSSFRKLFICMKSIGNFGTLPKLGGKYFVCTCKSVLDLQN